MDRSTIYFTNAVQDVPMCEKCNAYLKRVLNEPGYMLEFVKFVAPGKVISVRQCGKMYASRVSGTNDLQYKLNDFNLFCEFIAKRVYARRFSESKESK